ncbi:hypothetical protein RR48_01365 [Papilio machaon]|uniref:Uncharacterized protein n=1 Tax=Papilio machaon TaxID=76193 RepID=A0A0N0PDC1_PAPMA|nr:hypothetical protein RR48_01365 [Papilio machaon]
MKEPTLHEKCENIMNVVVETRKKFGKKCAEYDQKTSMIENKILNLQLESFSKVKFKPKYQNVHSDVDIMKKEMDSLITDLQEREKRINNLCKNVKNTEKIVLQLKEDKLSRKIIQPLTAEAKLK